ncbi:hypothetical protein GQ607_015319 [Colletotrichum asianum]|uniref:Uncharacterized protein n=1 Tax=Colletotrichum asianum TaxID=702518 RepID=A0A8H3ZFQ6_9PEZI|nr:hypothetical protein GQ607_015319 [Colletotrichum asianum]
MGEGNWCTKLPQIGGSLGEPRLSCCPTPYGPRRHGRENILLVTLADLRLFWAGPFGRNRECGCGSDRLRFVRHANGWP